jgi:hypothetical protein
MMLSLLLISFSLGAAAIVISQSVPSPLQKEPFFVGPLEIFSDLSANAQFVQVTVSLNTVLVAASVLSENKTEFSFDVIVGTSKSRGSLQVMFNDEGNSYVNANVTLEIQGQPLTSYKGEVYKWQENARPFPCKSFPAPLMVNPFYIGRTQISASLVGPKKLHVIVYSGTLPLAAFTLSASFREQRFETVIGLTSASGILKLLIDDDGFHSLQADEIIVKEVGQPASVFRGALFFWTATSTLSDSFSLPSDQPFYLGGSTELNCSVRSVDGFEWEIVDIAVIFSSLTGASTTLLPSSPRWKYDTLIGLTASNGSMVANFAPKGEISSVMADVMLYENGQEPVRYRGGIFFWMKA